MKKSIGYITMATTLALSLTMTSCKKYLDVNKSPNSAENVDPKLLFSAAEVSYATLRSSGDFFIPLALGGQSIADGGNNANCWGIPSPSEYVFSPNFFGNAWSGLLSTSAVNLKQVIVVSEAASPKNNNSAAQAKVLLAQTFYDLTILFGDVPYSEALNPEISYPHFDAQKSVFEGAIAMLDDAIAQFDEASPLKLTDYDQFYGGDIAKWKKAAKSLKLRILMTMVDKDPSKAAAIGALVTAGGAISSAADNMKFVFQNVAGRKNPKFALCENYFSGINPFFGSKYVLDFMRPLNDPRLPKMFDKPAAAADYFGITPGEDGFDNHDVRISTSLQTATEPEVFFSYQEELFFEAEVYARGLGVTVNLATANTLYKKAVEESCKFYGVAPATAATFAAGLPDLATVANPVKLLHYHHWVDKMEEGVDAFTEWRRSGVEGNETPALTLPTGAPAAGLFRRYEYHLTSELSLNPNAPAQAKYYEKMWFDL